MKNRTPQRTERLSLRTCLTVAVFTCLMAVDMAAGEPQAQLQDMDFVHYDSWEHDSLIARLGEFAGDNGLTMYRADSASAFALAAIRTSNLQLGVVIEKPNTSTPSYICDVWTDAANVDHHSVFCSLRFGALSYRWRSRPSAVEPVEELMSKCPQPLACRPAPAKAGEERENQRRRTSSDAEGGVTLPSIGFKLGSDTPSPSDFRIRACFVFDTVTDIERLASELEAEMDRKKVDLSVRPPVFVKVSQ
ncbi:MAG: hypothetical protein GF331_14375 [Chitinivibrionales bacterium]|nr:hypothetical protein [Chitinivibrionales bacterium]